LRFFGENGVAALSVGAFMISFSAVFVKLSGIDPTAAGFYRMFFAFLLLLSITLYKRRFVPVDRRSVILIIVSSSFFCGDIFYWHKAILDVGPGMSTLIANFQIFFLAAFEIFVMKKKPSFLLVFSIFLAFAGLYMLIGSGWETGGGDFQRGVVYSLITAMFYAGFLITLRGAGSTAMPMNTYMSMTFVTGITGLFLLIMALITGESLVISGSKAWFSMLGLGLMCQGLGWIIITTAMRIVPLTIGGLLLLLQPALSYVWDLSLFDKPAIPMELTGAVIALAAIYLGTLKK